MVPAAVRTDIYWLGFKQGTDGKIKPIPPGDDFAAPLLRRGGGDADLALAVRLQEDEIRAHTTVAAARRRDRSEVAYFGSRVSLVGQTMTARH